jgi:signal transduction histidine kinase
MKRPALTWLTFVFFLALGFTAMAWMTRTVLRLDHAQARATAAAQLEENVRLALWRMDYAMSPVISQETARPYFEYSPVFPAERAYTRMYTELKSGDVLVPSPLLSKPSASPYILLHFQVDPDGNVSSPQVPTGNVRKLALSRYTSSEDLALAERRLGDVTRLAEYPTLVATLPAPRDPEIWSNNKIRVTANGSLANTANPRDNAFNQQLNAPGQSVQQPLDLNTYNRGLAQAAIGPDFDQQQAEVQQRRGQQEFNARRQTQSDNYDIAAGNNAANYIAPPGVSFGVMKPVWVNGETLLLARQVSVNGRTYVQGCLLDWPAIRRSLVDSVSDLLPTPALLPVTNPTDDKQPRMLASIPARLDLPSSILHPPSSSFLASLAQLNPTHVTLAIAWLGVLLACAAVAVLLRGVMALSQRRAGFVSAVTHELRTPLTTLRMYTEMLADGMVDDPAKQATYHKTLRAEANRLGHLVDNVLLYSRLERSNRDTKVESAPLADLLDRLTPRLADRAAQAGMTLRVQVAPAAQTARIHANMLSVEQILFNLVDNACKYAVDATDRAIDVSAEAAGDRVTIRLADHGPGLDPVAKARLFQPFSKSVHEAANSAPGLGLGLALSYRLAKTMNATLRHVPTTAGTAFELTLPTS